MFVLRTRQCGVLAVLLGAPALAAAGDSYFLGAMGGVSTLSADGKSVIGGDVATVSLYKPENGPTFLIFGGRHWNDYLSFQASYGWNRNDLTLTSTENTGGDFSFYEQMRSATQHSAIGDVLVYFRKRGSRIRPYLAAGVGVVHLQSSEGSIKGTNGLLEPPGAFQSTAAALRVAVGIDVFLKDGWAFRYVFSETIRNNAISAQLSPPADRNLAHFQNLFGFVKYF